MKNIINPNATWEEISPGGLIPDAGNSHEFKTGDWRTQKPKWIVEKCKQCLLCYPTCPDSSIMIEQKENEAKMNGFDYDHCKGCGVCAKACPFNAIEMEDE